MSMDSRDQKRMEEMSQEGMEKSAPSPWELYRDRQKKPLRDSRLVSFGERITYTFAVGNEVASIHFDQSRGKIFYKGHNVRNADLEKWQIELLRHFGKVLEDSEYADHFLEGYSQALKKILHRKNRS